MTEQGDPVGYTMALNRLSYWETALAQGQAARDDALIREAARFVEQYRALLAEMMHEKKAPDGSL